MIGSRRRVPDVRSPRGCALLMFALVSFFALSLGGCGTAGPIVEARIAFDAGDNDAALERLDMERVGTRDYLLGLLERGMIEHIDGRIEDSVKTLKAAAALVEELDATFIGEESTSLLVNDRVRRYQAEIAERLWIRTVQMANFILLGDIEAAAVEARQAVGLYERYPDVLSRDIATRRLVARVFEAAGEHGAAAIEYARLFELVPEPAHVAMAALPAARHAGREQDVERYRAALVASGVSLTELSTVERTSPGSLVLLVSGGRIPPKRAGNLLLAPDLRISFPYYPDIPAAGRIRAYVTESTGTQGSLREDSAQEGVTPEILAVGMTDTRLGDIAKASLEERGRGLAAKQTARVVTKQAVVHAASHEDELLGAFVNVALFLLEEADTRSWLTLPAHLAIVEFRLPSGRHDLVVEFDDGSRLRRLSLDDVEFAAGRTLWREFRFGPGDVAEIVIAPGPPPDLLQELDAPS